MRGEGIAWDYFLAERLHKSVEEIKAIPLVEYELWKEYFNIKSVLTDLQRRTEQNRGNG